MKEEEKKNLGEPRGASRARKVQGPMERKMRFRRGQWRFITEQPDKTGKRPMKTANEKLTILVRADDPMARVLLTRAVKWLDRLVARRASIPHFFDNDTDPAPLARDVRRYLNMTHEKPNEAVEQ